MRDTRFPSQESNVMFIHLDEDTQQIPSLRGVNSCTMYMTFIEKYESFRGEVCEKFHASR
jgi:hypothetical protein